MNSRYFEWHWQKAQANEVESLTERLLHQLEEQGKKSISRGFVGSSSIDLDRATINLFLENISELLSEIIQKDEGAVNEGQDDDKAVERKLYELGMQFLDSARVTTSDWEFFEQYIDAGLDVNFQDPRSKATALHITAGQNGEWHVQKLLDCGRCDYLLLDRRFRLAHEYATVYSDVSDICSTLYELEVEEMLTRGYKDFDDFALSSEGHWAQRHAAQRLTLEKM